MSARRFTEKPELDPKAVRGLGPSHPAMLENRTLFPSTVVEVTEDAPDRLLVSGRNNRKLGETVEKGKFKGYSIYGLSLEERATCPDDCAVRDICYGNGMQMARRHRIGDPDVFFDRLGFEIAELANDELGLLIRLHVLGDFPTVEYVAFWADVLNEYPNVAIYGYTARRALAWDGDDIGEAIQGVKDQFGDRFRIRWSSDVSRPDSAVVVDFVPDKPRIDQGIVCPAQTDATACCATCGLCWEAPNDSIVFIRHGPKSGEVAAASVMAGAVGHDAELRPVAPIDLTFKAPDLIGPTPEVRSVAPTDLLVEASYQRELSGQSLKLIKKIASGWDWTKFKPPVCAEGPDGLLYVIDGQHTAIAAATLGSISKLPVLVVRAPEVEVRAAAFVSHNRDRLTMSPLQILHADATAGDAVSRGILATAARVGAVIPKSTPPKGRAKPGTFLAVRDMLRCYSGDGEVVLERILRIGVSAKLAPMSTLAFRALRMMLTQPYWAHIARMPDSRIANGLASVKDVERSVRGIMEAEGGSGDRIFANFITAACERAEGVAA